MCINDPNPDGNRMDISDYELALLVGLPDNKSYDGDPDTLLLRQMDKGEHFQWDKTPRVRDMTQIFAMRGLHH